MTDDRVPTEDEFGTFDQRGSRVTLRYVRRLHHPRAAVWLALTEPDQLAGWFPTTIEGAFEAGASLRFGFREDEGEPFDGRMLACEPPGLLEFDWADEHLRFELDGDGDGDGDGCTLRFTASFDQVGKAARDGAGWHCALDLLDSATAGRPAPASAPDRWRQIHPEYVRRYGPEASVLGPPEEWERVHGDSSGSPLEN